MRIKEGGWYVTQKGNTVGPLRSMYAGWQLLFSFDDYDQPGLWDIYGRCNGAETKTGLSYGNLVKETNQPLEENPYGL
jgi:hypothetical protein